MNILLTFTGFHDPYAKGLIGEEEQPGPILSLLSAKTFNHVVLFSTINTEKNTSDTEVVIKKLFPNTGIEVRQLLLNDPTNYIAILKGLRHHTRTIFENFQTANYFVAVASGTPQMHACWVLLVASGEIPACILHVRPPKFVSKDYQIVSEIDLTLPDFPIVRSNVFNVETDDVSFDVSVAIKKLGIVGDHPSIYKSIETAATLAQSNIPILILGETGTGKEVFAKFVHLLSGRSSDLFIPINCATIPENLVESVLFGHKKGAFTGAINDQSGKFDQADGGTLFLDELGELPLSMQAKLLRVLQDGIIEPIGAKKSHKVNVRIVAATNKDPIKAIKKGQFREDLYYRLNIGEIRLPSLRERKSDIPKIALYVLDRINATLKKPRRLSPGALTRLQEHSWPGNVRDLENVIERSVRLARRDILEADDLLISEPLIKSDPLAVLPEPSPGFSLEDFLSSVRKQMILKALELAEGNQSKAAKLLGITPQAVHKFLRNP
ncbi:MAG: sigma-54-dependent Fis family transcriptional regulator [wastewater metagenome]|nr:sigma-54-dependent Fis family transcriptional regulator [Candidatus Loosdrechtia aerotolerans]